MNLKTRRKMFPMIRRCQATVVRSMTQTETKPLKTKTMKRKKPLTNPVPVNSNNPR
jgi:hypothetical protein